MYKCIFCSNPIELAKFIDKANREGYTIISVTEKYGYTIIYKN